MSLVDKYRWGNVSNIPVSKIEIDQLATLESIKARQGWMIAAQVATVAAIAHQTKKTTDALRLVNDTLVSIEGTIQNGFDSLESSIERLESNLIENLNEIKWYLFNVDQKLDRLINLVKFSGATKSAEFNKQGFILYKIGSNEEAVEQFARSLNENPLNIEAYINLGFVYLRTEKLEESIQNFEKALRLIKEDFSYFEEISNDRLESTEVFILDNLSSLYALKNSYNQSIEVLNRILTKTIDKKTEVLSKYKLAKYLCLNGKGEEGLSIIEELINSQHFEPVSLAVASSEFSSIHTKILEILQIKLESVKDAFGLEGQDLIEKLNLIELEENTKEQLKNLLTELNQQIAKSSEFRVLLTSEFKESHHGYLNSISMMSELLSKIQNDSLNAKQDTLKLEKIAKQVEEIDSVYSYDQGVEEIAHKILLSKIKVNVKGGIDIKTSEYTEVRLLHEAIVAKINHQLTNYAESTSSNMILYLNDRFKLSDIVGQISLGADEEDKVSSNLFEKIKKDFDSHIEKYRNNEEVEINEKELVNSKYGSIIEKISEYFDVENDRAIEILKDQDTLTALIDTLPLADKLQFWEAVNEVLANEQND